MWWKVALKNMQVKKRGAGSDGPGGLKSLALQPGDVFLWGISALRLCPQGIAARQEPWSSGLP